MINIDFIKKYGKLIKENVYGIQDVYHYDEHLYVIEEGKILGVFEAYVIVRDTIIDPFRTELFSKKGKWKKTWTGNLNEAKIFCSEMEAMSYTRKNVDSYHGRFHTVSYSEAKQIQNEIELKNQ